MGEIIQLSEYRGTNKGSSGETKKNVTESYISKQLTRHAFGMGKTRDVFYERADAMKDDEQKRSEVLALADRAEQLRKTWGSLWRETKNGEKLHYQVYEKIYTESSAMARFMLPEDNFSHYFPKLPRW